MRRSLAGVLAAFAILVAGERAAAQPKITMREQVYEKLSRAQESAEAGDFSKAIEVLQDVEKMKNLEPYEKAQLYTAWGYINFSQEKYGESIAAYEKVLQQDELPEALRVSTLYTLAQLQFQRESYAKSLGYLEDWLAIASNPGPEPFILMAQTYYQLERYRDAVAPVERAIAIAREREMPVKESWYQLLRIVHHELEDYPKLLAVLETLVTQYPKEEYWMHLAAVYGEMGNEQKQLAVYELAYQQGFLEREREILLLSQLLLQAEVPYRAGVVLTDGIESGRVEGTTENWRLLSQAWLLAREDARAIEALKKAAGLSSDGELDARLSQSYANLGDWEKSAAAASDALRKGVKDAEDVRILLGTALFELEKFDEAKSAFRAAQKTPDARKIASQWITYIESEEARLRELRRSLQ